MGLAFGGWVPLDSHERWLSWQETSTQLWIIDPIKGEHWSRIHKQIRTHGGLSWLVFWGLVRVLPSLKHPKTNSSHLTIGHPERKRSYSNHPFSGAMLVSERVTKGNPKRHTKIHGSINVIGRVFFFRQFPRFFGVKISLPEKKNSPYSARR